MNNDIYYRPPWTCGKYNAKKHVAIVFNSIEQCDYFFEEDAADIIGLILSAGRNGKVSIYDISQKLQIDESSVNNFFSNLVEYGLLSPSLISKEVIEEYRNACKLARTSGKTQGEFGMNEEFSNAEEAYCEAITDYDTIYSVMFELTYRCNEMCIHCYNPGATRNSREVSRRGELKELSLDDYKQIIDELCSAGLVMASITGGEPFAYLYIWEIIDYLYNKDVAIRIFTNGQLLVGSVPRLAKYYPRDVRISVYSGVDSVHDGITQVKGSLKKTLDVIEQLVGFSTKVVINCPIITRNVQSYTTVKKIGSIYDSEIVFDVTIIDSMDGDICPTKNLRLTPEQLEVVLQDIDISGHVSLDDPQSLEWPKQIVSDGAPCKAGVSLFCVKPNGDLIPCNCFPMVLGNMQKQHFKDIIHSSTLLCDWRNTKAFQYIECWTHDYCAYCDYCVGNNFNEHGNPLKAGENNCYMAKNRYSLAQKLKSNFSVNRNIENIKLEERELKRQYRKGDESHL
jgi:MoaA/NifB/PqqE/SkfB family radical SAM enzyme